MNTNPEHTKPLTVTVIGATGLIGSRLLQFLQADDRFETIRVLTRRSLSFGHPKIRVSVIDFSDDAALRAGVAGSDAVFCSVGTTQRKVKGDQTAYRKVDYDIPVRSAKFCAETGCPHFLLVSSVGADSRVSNFYLKLKGEVEEAVRAAGIPSVSVFRPSMLLGERDEFRLKETVAKMPMKIFSFLIPSQYKAIEASDVAKAMIASCIRYTPGFQIYHYREIRDLAATCGPENYLGTNK